MKMRNLYLILAATSVVVTCEPQDSNGGIIWYPVDDEDGVFISIYGEKHRASHNANWRSHRRARYSGMEQPSPLPLSYDPTENQDPSFFHNVNDRRPLITVPPSFQNQQFPLRQPNKRPQGQASPVENIQEIFNEVFDYNKYPPVSENSGSRPESTSLWGNRPESTSQWGNTNLSSMQRPGNVWETTSRPPIQRPNTSGQQSNSRPIRPTNSEWINTNRPSNRPTSQSDKLIFPDEFSLSTSLTATTTTTPSNLVPTDPPTRSPCEKLCPVTPQFNPVCGTDGVTYTNAGRLKCASMCGKNVRLAHYGNCGRTSFITPLVSHSPKPKFSGFWLVEK